MRENLYKEIKRTQLGDFVAVKLEDGSLIGGYVVKKAWVLEDGEDARFFDLKVGEMVFEVKLGSGVEIMQIVHSADGRVFNNFETADSFDPDPRRTDEVLKKNNLPTDKAELLSIITDKWDKYSNADKADIVLVLHKILSEEDLWNLIDILFTYKEDCKNLNNQVKEFCKDNTKLVTENIDYKKKSTEFLKKYRDVKAKVHPDSARFVDNILFDVLGLKKEWLNE